MTPSDSTPHNIVEGDVDRIVQERFFPGEGAGRIFVDVGAARPDFLSISARYRAGGWRVVAIEPNPAFCDMHRKSGHEIYQYACGSRDEDNVDFCIVDSHGAAYENGQVTFESFSSLTIKDSYAALKRDLDISRIKVNLRRLDTILGDHLPEVDHIDILSVDVEGWELEVLSGLNVPAYRPSVIIIENLFEDGRYGTHLKRLGYSLWRRMHPNDVYVRNEFLAAREGAQRKDDRKVVKILLVSHSGERCGVQQYGRSLHATLAAAGALRVSYRECASEADLAAALEGVKPDAVIFNFHPSTLPWLTVDAAARVKVPTFGVAHEISQELADALKEGMFDFYLCPDPVLMPRNPIALPVPRFIPNPVKSPGPPPKVFTVGSFGFATAGKGFDRLCRMVNEQFDTAVIRINVPPHDDPRIVIPEQAALILEACRAQITKPGITLELTDRFMSDDELVAFLAANTINAFLYDHQSGRGISSCTDYALAAGRPIAISRSGMFRHLCLVNPSICIEDLSLRQIADNGFAPLQALQRRYDRKKSGEGWAQAISEALARSAFSRSVPDGRGFNKILDDRSREAYRETLRELEALAPELIKRKIPQANIQQAFTLDAVERFAREKPDAKILAVGAAEDTAVEALRAKGYRLDAIDPGINVDLNDFYLSAEGVPESYDIILCVSVLEHVRNDELFVQHVAELLAPGGVAVFTVDFRNDYVEGMPRPSVDFRLYSARDIVERLMSRIQDCALVDRPLWHDGAPEFEHDGATYNFASWVFRKLPAPWRQYKGDGYKDVRTTPWKDQLVAEIPAHLSVRTENDRFFSGYTPRYAHVRQLLDLIEERDRTIEERDRMLEESKQETANIQDQAGRALGLIDDVQRYLSPLAPPSKSRASPGPVHIDEFMAFEGRVFVEHAFRVLLGREVDLSALQHHLDMLQRGIGKAAMVRGIRYSQEGEGMAIPVRGLRAAIALEKIHRAPLLGLVVRLAARLFGFGVSEKRRMMYRVTAAIEHVRLRKGEITGQSSIGDASTPGSWSCQPDGQIDPDNASAVMLSQDLDTPAAAVMSAPIDALSKPVIYYFVDHTVRYPGNTGVQRVARRLGRALHELGSEIRFVKWNAPSGNLVLVDRDELAHLSKWGGPDLSGDELQSYPARGAAWVPVQGSRVPRNAWLVVPEVTHITYQAAPITMSVIMAARRLGLKTAFVFYDAVPLRQQDLKDMAQHHQTYMRQLMTADLLIPISKWTAGDLSSFFRVHERAGSASAPRVRPLPLPGESHLAPRVTGTGAISQTRKLILSVGSIVPHKNQLLLVEAFNRMSADAPDTEWELALAGNLHRDLARNLNQAAKKNKRIRYLGPVTDKNLDRLYRECAFTVFPSVLEGFGLPILESLWYAKPCICANFGAMAEVAEGGGCLTIDTRNVHDLTAAIKRLTSERGLLDKLTREAIARPMIGWSDYGKSFLGKLDSLASAREGVGTIYFCIDHTSSYPANTGIQRVTRCLARALMELGIRLVPFVWDRKNKCIHFPSEEQLQHFSRWNGPDAANWTAWTEPSRDNRLDWILLPELLTYLNVNELKEFTGYITRLGLRRAAVFYDAIPWTMRNLFPEIYPDAAARLHRAYMEQLNDLNLVFSISGHSRRKLIDFLDQTRLRTPALDERVQACILPGEFYETARVTEVKSGTDDSVRILCVGTVEPRKNHLGLLRAYRTLLKSTNKPVRLVIAGGGPLPGLSTEVQQQIDSLPGVTWEKNPDDERIQALYRECDFTIYPSLEEGFGLPILESLWNAKPCLCANFGSMAELIPDGGCLAVNVADDTELASAMLKLVTDEPFRMILAEAATRRSFKTWRDYAFEIVLRMAHERPLPDSSAFRSAMSETDFYREFANLSRRPKLSICITTYNRAEWLAVSLGNMARLLPQPREGIELVVCDNASTDHTPEVVKAYTARADFRYVRNPSNVGMLGNLQVTAHHARGEYIWILGDDDLVKPGAIETVLDALESHRDLALLYLNYAYTRQDDPAQVRELDRFMEESTPIVQPGPDQYGTVRDICANSENFFTAIYCLVFRRDHALRAYSQNTSGRPFSTMLTCIPTTHYVLNHMMDEPACWVGNPQVVVNMNVSWLKYAPLWVLERLPETYDLAERYGADPRRVDRWRFHNITGILHYFKNLFVSDAESNSAYVSPVRLIRRIKHLPEAEACIAKLRAIYQSAHRKGKSAAAIPESRVFSAFR